MGGRGDNLPESSGAVVGGKCMGRFSSEYVLVSLMVLSMCVCVCVCV